MTALPSKRDLLTLRIRAGELPYFARVAHKQPDDNSGDEGYSQSEIEYDQDHGGSNDDIDDEYEHDSEEEYQADYRQMFNPVPELRQPSAPVLMIPDLLSDSFRNILPTPQPLSQYGDPIQGQQLSLRAVPLLYRAPTLFRINAEYALRTL
ncbi:hypothetical protein VUR80DRAFT_386 [Thermomyces stellatus]